MFQHARAAIPTIALLNNVRPRRSSTRIRQRASRHPICNEHSAWQRWIRHLLQSRTTRQWTIHWPYGGIKDCQNQDRASEGRPEGNRVPDQARRAAELTLHSLLRSSKYTRNLATPISSASTAHSPSSTTPMSFSSSALVARLPTCSKSENVSPCPRSVDS